MEVNFVVIILSFCLMLTGCLAEITPQKSKFLNTSDDVIFPDAINDKKLEGTLFNRDNNHFIFVIENQNASIML